MAINFIPLGNAIDLVTSAVTDSITGSAITDAVLTAVLKTEAGVTLATSSSLTHSGGGVYKGTFDISAVSLTLNTHYYLSVAASNYAVQWKHLYRAEDRPFTGSSSAAIDTTPGTSGLPLVTGIPKGDGSGTYSAATVGADYAKPGAIVIHSTAGTQDSSKTTLATAVAAAVSGQTIRVGPGSYVVTSNLAKAGVNWDFAPGATVTRQDATSGFIFDDGGAAMTFTISGAGNFNRDYSALSAAATNDSGVLKVSHASSDITFHFRKLLGNLQASGNLDAAEAVIYQTGGKLTIDGDLLSYVGGSGGQTTAFCYGITYTNGEFNGFINRIETSYDQATADIHPIKINVTASPTGDFRLSSNKIYNANFAAATTEKSILFTSSQATATAWIDTKYLAGSITNSGGVGYVTGQQLLGAFSQDGATGTSESHLDFDKIGFTLTSNAVPLTQSSAGTVWMGIRQFAPAGSFMQELVKVSGGTFWLRADDLTAASSQDAILVSSGTLNVLSGKITNGGGGKTDLKQTGGTLNVAPTVVYAQANTSGAITSLAGTIVPGTTVNYTKTVTGAGTVYTLTATNTATVTFGTTSPTITLDKAGTWLLKCTTKISGDGSFVFSTNPTNVQARMRRTNNTAANIGKSMSWTIPGVGTSGAFFQGADIVVFTWHELYAATAGDIVVLSANISSLPDTGSATVSSTNTTLTGILIGP